MNFTEFKTSLSHAIRGIKVAIRDENNFRIQLSVSVVIIILSFILRVKTIEFIILILCVASVLALELLNTAIEHFLDIIKPRLDSQVQFVKDILAGMVLVSAIASALVGLLIFYPYLISFLSL